MKQFLSLMLSFLKIGIIGFGGGSALVPIIEEEIINKKKFLTEEEYNTFVIVSNITPGTLPVKLASAIGRSVYGFTGMLGAALMVSLPGVGIAVFLMSILSQLNDSVLNLIKHASVGISVFIILLLVKYIKKVLSNCKRENTLTGGWVVLILTFLLSSGKEIYKILEIDIKPIFDISTIHLLLLAFFIIFYTQGKLKSLQGFIALALSIVYVLAMGKGQFITHPILVNGLMITMSILALYGLISSVKAGNDPKFNGNKDKKKPSIKALLGEELIWITFLSIVIFIAMLRLTNISSYIIQGSISSVVSFGGGEAYISIAENSFVNGGFISSDIFYGQILPVANALPGPILSKVLAAIGYYVSYLATGSVMDGYMLAFVGYVASLAASCMVFHLVLYVYQSFQNLQVFSLLKTWILPIISGLLATTMVSMLYECLHIIMENQSKIIAFLIIIVIYVILVLIEKKRHVHDVVLLLISGICSLIMCNL